jgi:hypothetical protein
MELLEELDALESDMFKESESNYLDDLEIPSKSKNKEQERVGIQN